MQESYNPSYPQIQTDDSSLIIPECINWNIINTTGLNSTNYRERLMTENNNNSYTDDSVVPVAHSYTRKRRQFQFKQIDNIGSNYDSDDSDDESTVVNVPKTIKVMDILYNTNFSIQLRSEQNISTISHYLKNIINKTDDRRKNEVYSIKKIVNVLNWMMQDWKIESIVEVIVNITANWTLDESNKEDSRLGRLIRRITTEWDPQYLARLVSILFVSHPLCNKDTEDCKEYKEVFLKVLSKRWKFCRLSQFFICLGNKGAINHKLKMHLLQRAARNEDNRKMNFKFPNSQNKKQSPVVMPTAPQPQIYHPQPQLQVIPQSQSVDNFFKQNNQNNTTSNSNHNSPIYQTVMILPSQTVIKSQGSPSSTPGLSPHSTFYQIQDYQRPLHSHSPLNDSSSSVASSSNSPIQSSTSPASIFNTSIPVITTNNTTNIPMVTIRSLNNVMTMNAQQVPVVMSPPLTTNLQSNSPPVILSNVTVPSTPTSISNESFIRLPPGTPVFQAVNQQGTPIQTSNVITIATPVTNGTTSTATSTNTIDQSNNDGSVLFSPLMSSFSSTSSINRLLSPGLTSTVTSISPSAIYNTTAFINLAPSNTTSTSTSILTPTLTPTLTPVLTPIITTASAVVPSSTTTLTTISTTSSSSTSSINHSKLKGKETNREEEYTYYTTNPSSPSIQSNTATRQSLLFMTPSTTIYSSPPNTTSLNSINNNTNSIKSTSQSNNLELDSSNSSSSTSINVSKPIPLSLNVRNINQRITDLSLKKDDKISTEGMTGHSNHNVDDNNPIKDDDNNKNNNKDRVKEEKEQEQITSSSSSSFVVSSSSSTKISSKNDKNKSIDENPLDETSSSSSKTIITTNDCQYQEGKTEEEMTLKEEESQSPELKEGKSTNDYYEEIFNIDDFNHEEKKAIYDIIDSSQEDLEKIQMEKDETIRNFIKENSKEFSNRSSSEPKTPPPSLSSSPPPPFFQK